MKKIFSSILVAGTFDRLHVGHQFFLWSAKNICQDLIIIIARDKTVLQLKKKMPKKQENDRLKQIQAENLPNTTIRLGRADANFIETIREFSPEAILLGYDQFFDEMKAKEIFPKIKFFRAQPYFPELFKSSKF